MSKVYLVLISILSGLITNAFAYNCLGSCELGKQKVDFIHAAGNVKLDETIVTGGVHVAGNVIADKARMQGLHVAGNTTLDNTVVEGKMHIAGKFTANGSTFSDNVSIAAKANFTSSKVNKMLKVAGETELVSTRVGGLAKFAGPITAKNSVFDGYVTVAADKIIFTGTKLNKGLTVESKGKAPTVELICGTTLKGTITFEGKPGIVKTEQPNKVKLTIKNGKLEQAEKVSCSK